MPPPDHAATVEDFLTAVLIRTGRKDTRYRTTINFMPVCAGDYVLSSHYVGAVQPAATAEFGDCMRLTRRLTTLRPELLAFASSLTLASGEAEDLMHDAIVRTLQARSVPNTVEDLRPWMFRVIKNLFIDRKRKERVHREFFTTQGRLFASDEARTDDPVEALMVRQAYAQLPRRDREILCLIDMLGLTYAQAATVIDVPPGTVMSRVSRARRAMIQRMGETNVRPIRKRRG